MHRSPAMSYPPLNVIYKKSYSGKRKILRCSRNFLFKALTKCPQQFRYFGSVILYIHQVSPTIRLHQQRKSYFEVFFITLVVSNSCLELIQLWLHFQEGLYHPLVTRSSDLFLVNRAHPKTKSKRNSVNRKTEASSVKFLFECD